MNSSFGKLPWSWHFIAAIEKWLTQPSSANTFLMASFLTIFPLHLLLYFSLGDHCFWCHQLQQSTLLILPSLPLVPSTLHSHHWLQYINVVTATWNASFPSDHLDLPFEGPFNVHVVPRAYHHLEGADPSLECFLVHASSDHLPCVKNGTMEETQACARLKPNHANQSLAHILKVRCQMDK